MRGKTKDGYEVTINEAVLDDWEYLTLLRKVDKEDASLIVDVADLLLGEDQVKKLADNLRVDGRVPATAMIYALKEIMESVSELKNS